MARCQNWNRKKCGNGEKEQRRFNLIPKGKWAMPEINTDTFATLIGSDDISTNGPFFYKIIDLIE